MSGEEYEIEAINGIRFRNGKKEFRVKWKDYDQTSWVKESDLDCSELMEEYISKHQEEIEKAKNEEYKEEEEEEEDKPDEKGKKGKKPKKASKEKEEKPKEEKPKKEKEEKPKKKQQAEDKKLDKDKCKVVGYFRYKNEIYYTIEDQNGEKNDIKSNKARSSFAEKVIAFLESQLPKE